MSTPPTISLRRDSPQVAHVVIDNSARLNCLNTDLLTQFAETCATLGHDPHLRVVVVTGAGDRAFAGGADIEEMARLRTPEEARRFITEVHRACAAVRDLPVPVIARINGYALGAGMELAAACDLRVAAETAIFGMPEVKLGLPSVVEAALLPALVGFGRTREMLLLGENFGAASALAWGLVEKVVAPANLDAAVDAWIASVLGAEPRAVALQKALIRRWEELPMAAAVAAGIDAFAAAFETDEPTTSLARFRAERQAAKSVSSKA